MKYQIHDDINKVELHIDRKGIVEYANRFTKLGNYEEFGVVLRNEQGKAFGGISGNTIWNWLRIDVLFCVVSYSQRA